VSTRERFPSPVDTALLCCAALSVSFELSDRPGGRSLTLYSHRKPLASPSLRCVLRSAVGTCDSSLASVELNSLRGFNSTPTSRPANDAQASVLVSAYAAVIFAATAFAPMSEITKCILSMTSRKLPSPSDPPLSSPCKGTGPPSPLTSIARTLSTTATSGAIFSAAATHHAAAGAVSAACRR